MLHRYINFKFTEAEGVWQKTGKSAKVGQKNWYFYTFLTKCSLFLHKFCIFLHIYRYFDKKLLGTMFGGFGEKTGTFEEYIPVGLQHCTKHFLFAETASGCINP